jgi:hypothetical protein
MVQNRQKFLRRPKTTLRLQCLEYQLRGDRDRRFQRAIDRASIGKETVDAACGFSVRFIRLQFEDNVDAADHEHVVI